MYKLETTKIDETTLLNRGLDPIKINDYQILCLPENFERGLKNQLFDAEYTSDLSKILKQNGIRCANSYDLGIDTHIYVRRSGEIHLGFVWILDKIVAPLFVGALINWLSNISDKDTTEETIKEEIIRLDVRFPCGTEIKYEGDVKSLKELLTEEQKVRELYDN